MACGGGESQKRVKRECVKNKKTTFHVNPSSDTNTRPPQPPPLANRLLANRTRPSHSRLPQTLTPPCATPSSTNRRDDQRAAFSHPPKP